MYKLKEEERLYIKGAVTNFVSLFSKKTADKEGLRLKKTTGGKDSLSKEVAEEINPLLSVSVDLSLKSLYTAACGAWFLLHDLQRRALHRASFFGRLGQQ